MENLITVHGKSMYAIANLNETKYFFNKPAKDAFFNMGGFKTVLALLSECLKFNEKSNEQEYFFILN